MRLSTYLPSYYKKVKEMVALQNQEDIILENAKDEIVQLPLKNTVLQTDEETIARWEHLLDMDPLGDLVQRRMHILANLRGQGSLDEQKINEIVNAFTGTENSAKVDFVESKIRVRVLPPAWGEVYRFEEIHKALLSRIPAHIDLQVDKFYYTWQDIISQDHTWGQVKATFSSWGNVKTKIEE